MSAVGVVSIVFGVVVVCSRAPLLVAPASTLRWLAGVIGTNGPIRALGVVALALGAVMVWAGDSQHSELATILWLAGWAIVGVSTPLLLFFPSLYRAIVESMLPSDGDADMTGLRILGLASVVIGGLLIYFGALAL